MGILIRSFGKLPRQQWSVRRFYSSDITASAMVYSEHGPPSQVLKWHSYRLADLTPDTVHVKFLASPINPADVNMIQGVYPIKPKYQQLDAQDDKLLAVGGNEGLAQVIAVGDNVNGLKIGDHVVMAKTGYGTWRTHAAGPASDFQLLPSANNVSMIQKATITVNPCTAYRMLKDFVNLKQGDYVIQNGGNSAVGQAVIQIAKAWGLNTINVVRNRPDIDLLRKELLDLGATHVITDEELGSYDTRSLIKSWVGDKKPLLGLNCVGGKSATEMARYLGENGKFVTYGAMSKKPLSLPASLLIFKNMSFYGFWVSKWASQHTREENYQMLKEVTELMSQGKLAEPKWTQVKWDEETMKVSVDQGISGFATAPLPKKPSNTGYWWLNNNNINNNTVQDVQDACLELQQILHCQQQSLNNNLSCITRTGNPLVQDSSFIPLHQAVSQLSVSRRPRSYSVGDPRNHIQPVY